MCLAVPAQIIDLDNTASTARVDVLGATRDVNTLLVDDDVTVGDWVVVHVGFAIGLIDPAEAERSLRLLTEAIEAEQQELADEY